MPHSSPNRPVVKTRITGSVWVTPASLSERSVLAGIAAAADATCLVRVPSTDTARVQEAQILIGPVICAAAEQTLFAAGRADFPVCRPQRRAKKSATGDVALKIPTKGGWRRTDPRDQHVRII
jgi:hypothetical protein